MGKLEYEEHRSIFLQVKEILQSQHDYFALTKAFKKPYKWYGEHTVNEAVEILKAEINS